METVSPKRAAKLLGVHPVTLRKWALAGKVPFTRLESGHRRYRMDDLLELRGEKAITQRSEALYVRVSGRGDQLTSLKAQEVELIDSSMGAIYRVYADIGSGLSEKRPQLRRLLKDAERGKINVVRVTHADRLTRFGYSYIERLLVQSGCAIEVLHDQTDLTSEEELMRDFMSLLASFSGRLYGQRSKAARQRLLHNAVERA
jgi:putative resolvase